MSTGRAHLQPVHEQVVAQRAALADVQRVQCALRPAPAPVSFRAFRVAACNSRMSLQAARGPGTRLVEHEVAQVHGALVERQRAVRLAEAQVDGEGRAAARVLLGVEQQAQARRGAGRAPRQKHVRVEEVEPVQGDLRPRRRVGAALRATR